MRTEIFHASFFGKISLIAVGLVALTACSSAEQKVPKDDLQKTLISIAIPEMERQGTTEALEAVDSYRSKGTLPFTIEQYDCRDVATDTYDCTGKLTMTNAGQGPASIDFMSRVTWKDGKLEPVGPATFNGAEVNS